MFPHRSLILAILRFAFFSIEVPEKELSEEQYAFEAAAKGAYCFELNSFWHQSAEKGNQRIARIKDSDKMHMLKRIFSKYAVSKCTVSKRTVSKRTVSKRTV